MTPDLHAAATTLAADLAALHRAGRIASVWRAGMRAVVHDDAPRRVSWGLEPYGMPGGIADGDSRRRPANEALRHDAVPDLDDPLTVQGVVLLAREAWGDPHLCVFYTRQPVVPGWYVFIDGVMAEFADTEAAAACAAIRAAAAGVGT